MRMGGDYGTKDEEYHVCQFGDGGLRMGPAAECTDVSVDLICVILLLNKASRGYCVPGFGSSIIIDCFICGINCGHFAVLANVNYCFS